MFSKSIVSRVARVPAATRPAVVFARSFALSAPSKADDKKPLTEKLGEMASSAGTKAKSVMPDMVKESSPSTPGDAKARGVNYSEKINISESTVSDLPPALSGLTDPNAGYKEDQKEVAGGKDHGDLPRAEKTGGFGTPSANQGGASGYGGAPI